MWKRLIPAILITALAPSAADAFTMAETSATMGAHSAAAGSGGTSWTSAIGQTRSALSRSGATAGGGASGGANGKGWATGCSKGRSAGRTATGSSSWASAKGTSSAPRRR